MSNLRDAIEAKCSELDATGHIVAKAFASEFRSILTAHPADGEPEAEVPEGIGASGTEVDVCPVRGCGASGMENCSTPTGRDHTARWFTADTK